MTIPARDELIARVRAMTGTADGLPARVSFLLAQEGRIADLLDAEIRRAVADELKALRLFSPEHYPAGNAGWSLGVHDERIAWRDFIGWRLDALTPCPPPAVPDFTKPPSEWTPEMARQFSASMPGLPTVEGAAGSTPAPGVTDERRAMELASERADGRAASSPCPPPALSDADRLRAALNENRERYMELPQWARDAIGVPFGSSAPKPVDVFRAFGESRFKFGQMAENDFAEWGRDWFGPLDAALEHIEKCSTPEIMRETARCARAALRQRAQEASQ